MTKPPRGPRLRTCLGGFGGQGRECEGISSGEYEPGDPTSLSCEVVGVDPAGVLFG